MVTKSGEVVWEGDGVPELREQGLYKALKPGAFVYISAMLFCLKHLLTDDDNVLRNWVAIGARELVWNPKLSDQMIQTKCRNGGWLDWWDEEYLLAST